MNSEHDDDAHLLERLSTLRAGPKPSATLEDRTVDRLRMSGALPRTRNSQIRIWGLRAIAATVCFGSGYAFASTPRRGTGSLSPDQRIEAAAREYIDAIAAAPADDAHTESIALATLRSATLEAFHRYPNEQLGGALTFAFGGASLIAPGTPGREGQSVWY